MVNSQTDSANRPDNSSVDDEIMQLLVQHQRGLYVYLRSLLSTPADAEEVLQRTSIILWRKRQQFLVGSNFINWAMTIAQFEARKFVRNRKYFPAPLSEELLEQMVAETAARCDVLEERRRALEHCLETLSESERRLVKVAYGEGVVKKDVGQKMGMTPNGFYKALNRIRQRLHKCIEYRLIAERHA